MGVSTTFLIHHSCLNKDHVDLCPICAVSQFGSTFRNLRLRNFSRPLTFKQDFKPNVISKQSNSWATNQICRWTIWSGRQQFPLIPTPPTLQIDIQEEMNEFWHKTGADSLEWLLHFQNSVHKNQVEEIQAHLSVHLLLLLWVLQQSKDLQIIHHNPMQSQVELAI